MVGRTMVVVGAALVLAVLTSAFGMAQGIDEAIGLFNEGKYEEAERLLRPLTEDETDNPRAHYYLGLSLLEMDRLEEAESQLNRASQENLAPDMLKVGQARVALKKGETVQAITLLNEAQGTGSDNADIYHFRGIAKASRQDYTGAAADLEKAIMLDPTRAQSHYYAGMVYGRMRRTDLMVNHYQMFLRLAPNSPEASKVQSLLRSVR